MNNELLIILQSKYFQENRDLFKTLLNYILNYFYKLYVLFKSLENGKSKLHINNDGRRYMLFMNKRKAWDYIVTKQ